MIDVLLSQVREAPFEQVMTASTDRVLPSVTPHGTFWAKEELRDTAMGGRMHNPANWGQDTADCWHGA